MAVVATLPYRCENLSLSKSLQGELKTAEMKFLTSVTGYTGYTQKNGAVSIVFTNETVPFFCVYSVYYITTANITTKST